MGWPRTLGSVDFSRPVDQDFVRLWGWVKDHAGLVIVGLGAILRVLVYLQKSQLLHGRGVLVEQYRGSFAARVFGEALPGPTGAVWILDRRARAGRFARRDDLGRRLMPLLAGLLSLALFFPLALKAVPRRAALIGLALFAFSDDMIFYSSEIKQYSLEMAIALLLGLATLHAIERPFSWRIAYPMALLAIASPWLSFSAVFVVAACGLALVVSSVSRAACGSPRFGARSAWHGPQVSWPRITRSRKLLGDYTSMYIFWKFAFLPIWPLPMSILRTYETIGILLEVFANPLNMVHPLWVGVILPLVSLLIGIFALARRSWAAWVVLVVPILLAMLASSLEKYPFHGRLILELAPALFLLMALGIEWIAQGTAPGKPLAHKVLLVLLIGYPCLTGVNQAVFRPARDANSHGDLHRNLIIRYEDIMPSVLQEPSMPK